VAYAIKHHTETGSDTGSTGDFAVVGIGASAGGLEACRKLMDALPADNGMAFILVQHLDPNHASMMVDLLATHTVMTVREATDGMRIAADHLYVIPPGVYLSVSGGALHLSPPLAPHGARLPFDFLLNSLANAYGRRAKCVVLSGTGADGSLGLRTIKHHGGLVIAQTPEEAGYGGMPRSAILTGQVDMVLPLGKIPEALLEYDGRMMETTDASAAADGEQNRLADIIDVLRSRTPHDFTLYKPGTLLRRIARRMAMAAIAPGDEDAYLDMLRVDPAELDLLARDLLINVTSFFRDPKVFDLLAATIIPDMLKDRRQDQPLRLWVAGCSTGEETYSLTMLFREAMLAARCPAKLQVFASDVDPDAVATARDGVYPASIEAEVSALRLARFFTREGQYYRVVPELRTSVVFTVQDVLADPPFSRLDMVSCRNLLIYLRPEAQVKIMSMFHFALREGGILLLGSSETVGPLNERFEVVSKSARIYRHIGHSRPGDGSLTLANTEGMRIPMRPGKGEPRTRQTALAELCQSLVMQNFAPAALLANSRNEVLYTMGPTDRYLRVPAGTPTQDLLALARPGLRTKLRSAIQRATQENGRAMVASGPTGKSGAEGPFTISVQPVAQDSEQLLFICFLDEKEAPQAGAAMPPGDFTRVAELEQELEATRAELQAAIRNLEVSNEEQIAINEEALSVNEEFQSTNEELLTSKEELQSMNEELTALNTQLQETLERHRTTANDLQNVLFSTDVATLFLDTKLAIRFFTPSMRSIFSVIPGDIGRPLADLHSLAMDTDLLPDALAVLRTLAPMEREVESRKGSWYCRRILPYNTQEHAVEGVVITFTDITEQRRAAGALDDAKRTAEMANTAKSRFLAAASHDLRQPLQTLSLLQGLLAKSVESDKARGLVVRLDETLGAMGGMLNTLLDINQIESGTVQAEKIGFPVNDLLDRLRAEFGYHAQANRLDLRVMPCSLTIYSDPRLLEQIMRNLLSNAIKYTKVGRVLVGCRRRGSALSIEFWDTGIGISDSEIKRIFEEYHQVGNPARERSRGLGLGLSIVERLADLLGHKLRVASRPGLGSMFAVEIAQPARVAGAWRLPRTINEGPPPPEVTPRAAGTVLIVEDDHELRELLAIFLREEGHRTSEAVDGVAALALLTKGDMQPDLILADYNLPGGLSGLELCARMRERLHKQLPVIILTGDISTDTLRAVAAAQCMQLTKPVKLEVLSQAIQRLLPPHVPAVHSEAAPAGPGRPVIFVIDDNTEVCQAIRSVLEADGLQVEDFPSCETFLAAYKPGGEGCLVVDAYLPGMTGLELLRLLRDRGHTLPSIMITGRSDVAIAVDAMKAGAADFIEKPISRDALVTAVGRALDLSRDGGKLAAWRAEAQLRVAGLTARQRAIMTMVLAGHPSKNIAADLGISQRTVENHRAAIMKKTGASSLPALARLALAAESG
jgi:two-component system CheB/CheR fusion protein